jgi:hypothetical protein
MDNFEKYRLLMMKYLDNETTPEEAAELTERLENDPELKQEFETMQQIKRRTQEMKADPLPEIKWQDYWKMLYNRMERGLAWILISIGAIIWGIFAIWELIQEIANDQTISPILKFGLFALLAGAFTLLVSVVREKLWLRKYDKYKEIQR